MGQLHTVKQGDHMASIARQYGFASYTTLWDAPENQSLKKQRVNPSILLPGDQVFIPEKETREETRSTETKSRFQLLGDPLKLRLELMGLKNEPLSGHQCTLAVENESEEFTTGGDGLLEISLSAEAKAGKLMDRGKPGAPLLTVVVIPLKIGHLDPIDTISGQIGRLNNLGYSAGIIPEHVLTPGEEDALKKSARFLSAVEEFQCDFKLAVDGVCGPNTQKKLSDVHGC